MKRISKIIVFLLIVLGVYQLPVFATSTTPNLAGFSNPIGDMKTSTDAGFDSSVYLKNFKVKHVGTDFGISKKTQPVYAIADGYVYHVVVSAATANNMSVIFIRHKLENGTTFTAVYGHTYADASIKEGTSVTKGQVIGKTTNYNSYHLHFGINVFENIETSGTLSNTLSYGWGRVPKSADPKNLGWRDPVSWLNSNAINSTKITQDLSHNGTADYGFGSSNDELSRWQGFQSTTTGNLTAIEVKVKKIQGSDQSDLKAELFNMSNGYPTGAALASATIPASSISADFSVVNIPLKYSDIKETNRYCIVLSQVSRRGAHYGWCSSQLTAEPFGKWNGSNWIDESVIGDGWLKLYYEKTSVSSIPSPVLPPTPVLVPVPNPNPNQILLFEDANYLGKASIFNIGDFADPVSNNFFNDTYSSVLVGSNVKVYLYEHSYFNGTSEELINSDSNLTDNAIGNDRVSSFKVVTKDVTPVSSNVQVPGTPNNLRVTSVATNYINLAWDAVYGAQNYQVFESTNQVDWWSVAASDAPSCQINGLSPGLTYYFRVRTHNQAGDSAYTSNLQVVTNK